MQPLERLYGHTCIILPSYKAQKKAHRNKLINFIYRIVYGYVTRYAIDQDMVVVGNIIYFKNMDAYNSAINVANKFNQQGGQQTNGRNNLSNICNENK